MATNDDVKHAEPDLVSVLLDEHARARAVLAEALRLLSEGAEDDVTRRIATAVERFVTFTSPAHELDEEQNVFPALRAYGPKDEVNAALTELVDEHISFDELREKLALRWGHVADAPACLNVLQPELSTMTKRFARVLSQQAEHEELVIFPLVRKYVPLAVQVKTLAAMLRREGG
jgi:hemerythrin-like domain-containing protein